MLVGELGSAIGLTGVSAPGSARPASRPRSSSKIVFRILTRRLCSPLKSRPVNHSLWAYSGVAHESGQKRHGAH